VNRRPLAPVWIVGIFLIVLAALAFLLANDWGEFAALAFSIVWLGCFKKRRFAVGASLCCSFALMAVTFAFGSSMANVFGDGVFGAAIVLLFTMKRRPEVDCTRVLVISDPADAEARDFIAGLPSGGSSPDAVCFTTAAHSGRNAAWLGIAAADERDVDVIYAAGALRSLYAGIAVGVATGRPVVGHLESGSGSERYEGLGKMLIRMWLSNARRIFAATPDAAAAIVSLGYPSNRCEVLPLSMASYERVAAVIASERNR
jgi:hypothetical protein